MRRARLEPQQRSNPACRCRSRRTAWGPPLTGLISAAPPPTSRRVPRVSETSGSGADLPRSGDRRQPLARRARGGLPHTLESTAPRSDAAAPVSRAASRMRAAVFIASPISAISFFCAPSSPITTGPAWMAARKAGTSPNARAIVGARARRAARRAANRRGSAPLGSAPARQTAITSSPTYLWISPPSRDDLRRHVGEEGVEQIEEALLAEPLGERRSNRSRSTIEQHPLLAARPAIAPGGEGEQHAGPEQFVDAEQQVERDAASKSVEGDVAAGRAPSPAAGRYSSCATAIDPRDTTRNRSRRAARNRRERQALSARVAPSRR